MIERNWKHSDKKYESIIFTEFSIFNGNSPSTHNNRRRFDFKAFAAIKRQLKWFYCMRALSQKKKTTQIVVVAVTVIAQISLLNLNVEIKQKRMKVTSERR